MLEAECVLSFSCRTSPATQPARFETQPSRCLKKEQVAWWWTMALVWSKLVLPATMHRGLSFLPSSADRDITV
ncbi:hypothetical protein E2C01_019825 [Portunus trituberculatus]|uniref:Uncharacterized protein n=1 Tax=Portunus trituberculatus TaxID=210409 RepID=A0A5B7DZX0_PORTR|nr:hypothetical protein [Portunus trituberculatus]